jgi:hypothetical protein
MLKGSIYDFKLKTIDGESISLAKFKGKKINENHLDYLSWIASLEDISVSERKFIDEYCGSVKA